MYLILIGKIDCRLLLYGNKRNQFLGLAWTSNLYLGHLHNSNKVVVVGTQSDFFIPFTCCHNNFTQKRCI